jgi:hypothetical protein
VLFVHEVHSVRGSRSEAFELAVHDGWMKQLAKGDDARLLWYCVQAHGTGQAYQVVTITAVTDARAWEDLAHRIQSGDLLAWARHMDELRHKVDAKLLLPVRWSPMQRVELSEVPVDGQTHEPSLYMEDTGWPDAALDDYIDFWESGYFEPMTRRPGSMLDIQAVFQPAFGSGRRKEAILMQRITDNRALMHLLTTEIAPELRAPGQFMHEALSYRDRWESRLLRTSSWSPFH